jgi:hypothetical protein
MVNQSVHHVWHSRNTKLRIQEDTETNELIRALNNHQSETENTINRQMN